jgi:ABC-2 type transport system permease protein
MKMFSLCQRELSTAFRRPVAYVVIMAFVALCGLYTFSLHPFFVIGRVTVRPLFDFIPFALAFFVPAVAMGLIAEERRSGMLELLQTWPLGDGHLVLGKYLGALVLIGISLGLTLPIPIVVAWMGPLDWGPVFAGYLGMLLLSAAYLSLGLVASASCRSQIVAFIIGFMLCFGFYVLGKAGTWLPAEFAAWPDFLSFERRVSGFVTGVIDLRDVVYFLAVSICGVGLSAEVLNRRRWRDS